jgi:hypothetical protein
VAAPSVLHLIHPVHGGDQIISLMFIGLGGCTMTSNFFKVIKSLTDESDSLEVLFPVIKSLTDELDSLEVLFPERLTAEIIELIASFQLGFESWNLHWFL